MRGVGMFGPPSSLQTVTRKPKAANQFLGRGARRDEPGRVGTRLEICRASGEFKNRRSAAIYYPQLDGTRCRARLVRCGKFRPVGFGYGVRSSVGADGSLPARGPWFWPCFGPRGPAFRRFLAVPSQWRRPKKTWSRGALAMRKVAVYVAFFLSTAWLLLGSWQVPQAASGNHDSREATNDYWQEAQRASMTDETGAKASREEGEKLSTEE